MWIKRHRLWTAILVAFLILAAFVIVTLLFHLTGEICSKDEFSGQKQCTYYNVVLVALWHVTKAANDFGVAITALATIAVAAFTGTLWFVSREQGRIAQRSIDLARKEFISTFRPRVIARNFRTIPGCDDHPWGGVEFLVVNVGESDACEVEIRANVLVEPRRMRHEAHNHGPSRLVSGEGRLWVADFVSREMAETVQPYFVIGEIIYRDDLGTVRESGFIRASSLSTDAWVKVKDSDFEYAY